jgi:hypothetical protein
MCKPEELNEALHAELRLFCHLMLGSADAADRVMPQIYHRALDHPEEDRQSERVRLFGIAADLCAARGRSSHE